VIQLLHQAAGMGLKRVREQEMLDDDSVVGDIIVEISTLNPSHGSGEQAARMARCKRRQSARDVAQSEHAIGA
jgi:hypothetical protein